MKDKVVHVFYSCKFYQNTNVCVCLCARARMYIYMYVPKSDCRQHIVPSFSSVSALMLCISSTTSRMSCNSSREKCSRRSGWYTWHRGGGGAMDTGHVMEVYTSKVHIHMCKSRQ